MYIRRRNIYMWEKLYKKKNIHVRKYIDRSKKFM